VAGKDRKPLKDYRKRRDFRKSPEPGGEKGSSRSRKRRDRPTFVIQEHRASSHHFDFRLEVDGVLKSWAVPKGPSTDPGEKRLAVAVEDHPLAYADFEGMIPEEEYGAGSVIVWDRGPYRSLRTDDDGDPLPVSEQIDGGHVEIWLEGKKLQGGFALVHSKLGGKRENWLLVKMKDEEADARRNPVSTQRESVLSGRTVDEVAEESDGDA
jgi:DNA ligase D-like protein (predicted 3'-phosphoesterase)